MVKVPKQTSYEKATYYNNIPADVRFDKALPYGARLLYGEIAVLASNSGVCWASNSNFANQYSVSKQCISDWLLELQLTIKKLLSFSADPGQQKAILQQAIMNGWQTIYPLKEEWRQQPQQAGSKVSMT